jgi:glycosyltransferase involved in cell wall biosynthesis
MKRIAVVTSSPPFTEGGHLVIARSLVTELRAAGHDADLWLTPQNRFGRQASAYLATWLTDIDAAPDGRRIDQVISFRYPSYAVRHPLHVCWLNHRMREYYDLWPQFSAPLSARNRIKETVRRRLIHAVDRYLLTRNVTRLYAQSSTIQRRLATWGHIPSEVLYPPPPPRPYRCDDYDDFFLAVSRLTPLKRIDLVIRALAEREAAGIRLVVAGDGEERRDLEHLADDLGVSDRVRFAGATDGDQLVAYLASCRAVCFTPQYEDYGLVTVEAFASHKAVVTCRDSGGPAELVEDGVSGMVCAPEPRALAQAMRRLADDRHFAEVAGAEAHRRAVQLSWPNALKKLVIG